MQNLQTQPEFPTCAASEYLTYNGDVLRACTATTEVQEVHQWVEYRECDVCPVAAPLLPIVLVTAILTTFAVRLLSRIWPK